MSAPAAISVTVMEAWLQLAKYSDAGRLTQNLSHTADSSSTVTLMTGVNTSKTSRGLPKGLRCSAETCEGGRECEAVQGHAHDRQGTL